MRREKRGQRGRGCPGSGKRKKRFGEHDHQSDVCQARGARSGSRRRGREHQWLKPDQVSYYVPMNANRRHHNPSQQRRRTVEEDVEWATASSCSEDEAFGGDETLRHSARPSIAYYLRSTVGQPLFSNERMHVVLVFGFGDALGFKRKSLVPNPTKISSTLATSRSSAALQRHAMSSWGPAATVPS